MERRIDVAHPHSSDQPNTLGTPRAKTADARMDGPTPVTPRRDSPVPDTDSPLHVVPSEDGWALRFEGISTPVAILPTKAEAMKRARSLTSQTGSNLVEHGADGQIR